jgi:3-oxoacyl-[acyl-carrier-protein] synthase-3
MALRIEASGVASGHSLPFVEGALDLADRAIRACLDQAGASASDLDVLVNAGIYRQDNLAEPALASMIQEDIGANPGHPPQSGAHGTFSFDLNAGGCGMIVAVELLAGFVDSGTIETGLVVASDAGQSARDASHFPFPPVGGALLVRSAPPGSGFVAFRQQTIAPRAGSFTSYVSWHERDRRWSFSAPGKNLLDIEQSPAFADETLHALAHATTAFLAENALAASDIDLVIPSQYPVGLPRELARLLKLPVENVVELEGRLAGAHTAGPIAAWDLALRDGRLARAKQVLFATAGAGLMVGLALYRL